MVHVIVGHDDRDIARNSVYFGALRRYRAVGIGHSNGTSSMFIPWENFDLEKLGSDLGDIPILEVYS